MGGAAIAVALLNRQSAYPVLDLFVFNFSLVTARSSPQPERSNGKERWRRDTKGSPVRKRGVSGENQSRTLLPQAGAETAGRSDRKRLLLSGSFVMLRANGVL